MNTIFVAQSHRDDVVVYLVLESTLDFSRTIYFRASELGHLGGFYEQNLTNKIAKALTASRE
jgi:tRNA (pseudouridine54-N1)-methyltransferase